MNLTLITTLFLTAAVCIGVYLTFVGLTQQKRIPGLGYTHATLALTGVTVLFINIYTGTLSKLHNAAALFLVFAVIGGGMVFALHAKDKPPAMAAVAIHALMGLVGLSLLLISLS